jgi:peptide methionine sulfoxide reductase MsrA
MQPIGRVVIGCVGLALSVFGMVWYFKSPPLGSKLITGPPAHTSNDPAASVYFGYGCFWHGQYDMWKVEREKMKRSIAQTTSLVGYAGGLYESGAGKVCYHGLPSSSYGQLGHAEVVSVQLDMADMDKAEAQFTGLCEMYFKEGFQHTAKGMQRLDPMDSGADYRNAIGLPGGVNSPLYPIVQKLNTENNNMPLQIGKGGDKKDEYVVWVYDSTRFPFFRAEPYHQFHQNTVLQRPIPTSYSSESKKAAESAGRINDTGCSSAGLGQLMMLLVVCFVVAGGLSGCLLYKGGIQLRSSCRQHGDAANDQHYQDMAKFAAKRENQMATREVASPIDVGAAPQQVRCI